MREKIEASGKVVGSIMAPTIRSQPRKTMRLSRLSGGMELKEEDSKAAWGTGQNQRVPQAIRLRLPITQRSVRWYVGTPLNLFMW